MIQLSGSIFFKISHLTAKLRAKYDCLCDFIHRCKQFISPLASEGRPDGDVMSAIGWSQDLTRLKILDQYRHEEAIEKNREVFDKLMEESEQAGKALWDAYSSLANIAADNTKKYIKELSSSPSTNNDLPANPNGDESCNPAAASLAFPSNDFHVNQFYEKTIDPLKHLSFAMVIPDRKSVV